MKRLSWKSLLILLIVTLVWINPVFPGNSDTIGKLSFFVGDVRIRPVGQSTWDKATLNQDVHNGASIRTGSESRVELKLIDNSVFRIGENSVLELNDLVLKEGKLSGKSSLPFGRMWSNMKKLSSKGVEVRSPNAVMAIRGTTFRADAHQDSSLSLFVYEGTVAVNLIDNVNDQQKTSPPPAENYQQPQGGPPVPVNPPGIHPVPGPYEVTLEEWLQIVEGMKIYLKPDGKYEHGKFDIEQDRADDWVEWNMQRDSLIR